MRTLVLLRHGQSQWNLENRFTGWGDVDLSTRGKRRPGRPAPPRRGRRGRRRGLHVGADPGRPHPDLALEEMGRLWVPVRRHWRLNERHYGGLTGLDKAETAAQYGDGAGQGLAAQLRHPAAALWPGLRLRPAADPRYAGLPRKPCRPPSAWPTWWPGCSPYWHDVMAPDLGAGRRSSSPPTATGCGPSSSTSRASAMRTSPAGDPHRRPHRLRARRPPSRRTRCELGDPTAPAVDR